MSVRSSCRLCPMTETQVSSETTTSTRSTVRFSLADSPEAKSELLLGGAGVTTASDFSVGMGGRVTASVETEEDPSGWEFEPAWDGVAGTGSGDVTSI